MRQWHPAWIIGLILVLQLGVLIALIAMGTVKEESSFGLDRLISGLLVLLGGFAQWAFNTRNTRVDQRKIEEKEKLEKKD